jgi:hypothetical protein
MTQTSYRASTDAELMAIYAGADEDTAAAILAEMARRDRAARAHARDAARWAATYAAWHDFAHAQYLAAEAETNGYLLNKAGVADGIDPWALWSGAASVVAKYASEELRSFFDRNARMTVSEYHGQVRRERRAAREAYEGE